MEPTYTVLGSDGNQYGPVSAEQFRGWLAEGRVTSNTQVWRSDLPAWVAAGTLPEGAGTVTAAAPAPISASAPVQDAALEQQLKSGASWFYWVAAMSLINSVLILSGSSWGFALGLGITSEIDYKLSAASTSAKALGFAFSAATTGVVALLGFFANKRHAWAFVIGMILLTLDTVLTVRQESWISMAFHTIALFCIFKGFQACRALRN